MKGQAWEGFNRMRPLTSNKQEAPIVFKKAEVGAISFGLKSSL